MTPDDSAAFRELIGTLYVMIDKPFDEPQVAFYWQALKDLPLLELKQAAVDVMQGRVYRSLPLPGELRTAIFTRKCEQRRTRDLQLAGQRLTLEVYCADCRDTGWKGEDTLSVCPCRERNPNYQIGQARQRLGDDDTAQVDAPKVLRQVRDFKQIGSGE